MHFIGRWKKSWDPLVIEPRRDAGGDPVRQRRHFEQLGEVPTTFEKMAPTPSPSSRHWD